MEDEILETEETETEETETDETLTPALTTADEDTDETADVIDYTETLTTIDAHIQTLITGQSSMRTYVTRYGNYLCLLVGILLILRLRGFIKELFEKFRR